MSCIPLMIGESHQAHFSRNSASHGSCWFVSSSSLCLSRTSLLASVVFSWIEIVAQNSLFCRRDFNGCCKLQFAKRTEAQIWVQRSVLVQLQKVLQLFPRACSCVGHVCPLRGAWRDRTPTFCGQSLIQFHPRWGTGSAELLIRFSVSKLDFVLNVYRKICKKQKQKPHR